MEPPGSQIVHRQGQDGAKSAPRWAKTVPNDPKMGPNWSEKGAKTGQDEATWSPDWPSGATPKNLEKRVLPAAPLWTPKRAQIFTKNC